MTKFIQNLQNKPEPFKKTIMWVSIFLIMMVISAFWLLTFPSRMPKIENNEATTNLKKELPSVWQTFKSQINTLQNLWQK